MISGVVFCEDWDWRRQFWFIQAIDSKNPQSHKAIANTIYHIANNICQLKGLEDDGEWNNHIACLVWHITEKFYAWLFWMSVEKLAI
jgi:hypothetical protein